MSSFAVTFILEIDYSKFKIHIKHQNNEHAGNDWFPLRSIDLLTKFADDLQFEFDLTRVEDPKWGVLGRDGKWNGLMEAIVEKRFDMALTSLKVNAEREAAVDFTAPFLESGDGFCFNALHCFDIFVVVSYL